MTGDRHRPAPVPGAQHRDGAVPDGAVPDGAVVAALALDAALDLARGHDTCGGDGLLRAAAAVRASAAPAGPAAPLVRPGRGPSRQERRRTARHRVATVATLAASMATIAAGADLALPSGIGPTGQAAAPDLRLARSHGLVVLAAPGSASPAEARVAGVTCPGPEDCLASARSGSGAVLATSHNGGVSWSLRPAPGGITVVADVQCGSPARCLVVGGSGHRAAIEVSTDGGRTWHAGSLPGGIGELRSIACSGIEICWAVGAGAGGRAVVVATTDGGAHWSDQPLPTGVTGLDSVSCPSAVACWAGGSAGGTAAMVATTDGGTRWSPVSLPAAAAAPGDHSRRPAAPQGAAVASVTCASPSSCWAVETSPGSTSIVTGGSGGWQAAAGGQRHGTVYASPCTSATATTAGASACGAAPGAAFGHVLDVVEGTPTGEAGTTGSALSCPTSVECWVAVASGDGGAARALAPGAALTA